MKRLLMLATFGGAIILVGCGKKTGAANGDGYRVVFKELRQNTAPAVGFKIEVWIKGKSEPKTIVTDDKGMAELSGLPQPDATHQVNANWRYFRGKKDQTREISYPYLDSDKERMKDTQYIPNDATPDPS